MREEIEQVKQEAKWAPGSWFGINVARLNLTREEKKRLVAQGYRLTEGRGGKLILTYSQEARQEHLREKIESEVIKMAKVKCFESERVVVESPWLKSPLKMMYVGLRSLRGKGDYSIKTAALRAGQPANVAGKSLKELVKIGLVKNGADKSGKNGIEFILVTGTEKEQKDLIEKLKQPAEVESE